MCGKSGACAPVESAGAQVLVAAGLMTDVPPCNCPKGAVAKTCVHHSAEWLRIRCRIVVRAAREDSDRMSALSPAMVQEISKGSPDCPSLMALWLPRSREQQEGLKMGDRIIEVPDTAQFFRVADDQGRLDPVTVADAQCGDVVVLADRRAGAYLGQGRMRVEGGEWAQFVRTLPFPIEGITDATVYSIDPLDL